MKRACLLASLTCLVALVPALATAQPPPTDIATGVAEPSQTSARVVGYWNYGQTFPPGIPDDCWFDYGTTLAYGSRVTAICSGTSYATLSPLVPGTIYHYRAAGSNSAGTTYGPDRAFTTLGSPPPPATPAPGGTVPTRARLAVVSGQSLPSVLHTGLRLRVTISGSCPCLIRGRLLVSRTTSKRLGIPTSTSIGLSRDRLGAPGTADLKLKLKSSVKRKLRRARGLKATVRVTVTGASGQRTVASRSIRLKSL
jgi:hypothetical protein